MCEMTHVGDLATPGRTQEGGAAAAGHEGCTDGEGPGARNSGAVEGLNGELGLTIEDDKVDDDFMNCPIRVQAECQSCTIAK